ncbi:unnamed protein product (macronuclear) [Paramecium tetraurelia]|uniref:TLDc domain-containing protein n=1 Tax=Paramecium tetraurelia TaxID=5888 RepID=A0E049_PARTE|nr:uncharacterized protein GSPATT00021834001 [Paramecium tetraurelia]CAK88666.1 unnamed protein product [Paramecium tetraurelia]|eukprot:XP_001456063.1 hypothetical protein (macronuclear) [Paramecium tetraurelia strain d4-2]
MAQKKILIANLNGLNRRKFLLKIDIKSYINYWDSSQQLLLNKTQNNLFIAHRNQILIFEQSINGWKCSQSFQVSSRCSVSSIFFNFQEDELQIYSFDGYDLIDKLYIFHKQTQEQEINWVLIQKIGLYGLSGQVLGGFLDHIYFADCYGLDVYKKQNQSQYYIMYASSEFKHHTKGFFRCVHFVQNKFLLLEEDNNSIRVMKINQQQQLEFIKQIDIPALKSQKSSSNSQRRSFLTQDEKFLVIQNNEITLLIELIYA